MTQIMDDIDRKILQILQNDASISIEHIATTVPLSRNACWRRIKRLEDTQIIQKRVALVDPQALGLTLQAVVLIRTNDHSATWLASFQKAVRDMPQILSAQRMSGDLDYILKVRVADMAAYDRFYQSLIAKVPISDVSASFVMEDLKDTTALPT